MTTAELVNEGIDVADVDRSNRFKIDERCPGGDAHFEHLAINGDCPWCGMTDKSKWGES